MERSSCTFGFIKQRDKKACFAFYAVRYTVGYWTHNSVAQAAQGGSLDWFGGAKQISKHHWHDQSLFLLLLLWKRWIYLLVWSKKVKTRRDGWWWMVWVSLGVIWIKWNERLLLLLLLLLKGWTGEAVGCRLTVCPKRYRKREKKMLASFKEEEEEANTRARSLAAASVGACCSKHVSGKQQLQALQRHDGFQLPRYYWTTTDAAVAAKKYRWEEEAKKNQRPLKWCSIVYSI